MRLPGEDPETPVERAAILTWWLAHGECISHEEAAMILHLSEDGAYRILCRLSRVLPIYRDVDGWQVVAMQELE
jgi:hypothetical protein